MCGAVARGRDGTRDRQSGGRLSGDAAVVEAAERQRFELGARVGDCDCGGAAGGGGGAKGVVGCRVRGEARDGGGGGLGEVDGCEGQVEVDADGADGTFFEGGDEGVELEILVSDGFFGGLFSSNGGRSLRLR